MRSTFLKFIFERRVLFLWVLSFLINSITLAIALGQGNRLQAVVLQYNVIVGAELFGKASQIAKIPLAGFFVLVVNSVLYAYLKGKQNFLAEAALAISFLVSVFSFLAVVLLRTIN